MSQNDTTIIKTLVECFPIFLRAFKENCPFKKYGQFEYHDKTIRIRKEHESVTKALENNSFLNSLYSTLEAWGLGSRASNLKEFPYFVEALRAKENQLSDLENILIDDPDLDVSNILKKLSNLIFSLDIVDNKAKLVSSTKTLHHLLPDLVVPIDRAYTQSFFGWQNTEFQYNQKDCFEKAFRSFVWVARQTNPQQYVGEGWNTSRTKVIDNAIVGVFNGGIELVKKYIS